ncbi:MAG: hypothetical protein KDH88_18430 [Chromatiales bacterium]|nr:hypothetical protein [Chromatiales bacterium]
MAKAKQLIAVLLSLGMGAATPVQADGLSSLVPAGLGVAAFDPANGVLPFPNDALFSGSQDGTLNIPVDDPADLSDPAVAINALDGFSTVAPITATFTRGLNPDSIHPGGNVRLFEVSIDPLTKAVTGLVGELIAGEDYAVGISPVDETTLDITPLRPLNPSSGYLAAALRGLREPASIGGGLVNISPFYVIARLPVALLNDDGSSRFPAVLNAGQAAAFEPLRLLTGSQLAVLTAAGIDRRDVILSWSFSTQSVGNVLSTVRTRLRAGDPPNAALVDSGADSPFGAADLYVGSLDVPYYLSAPGADNSTAPLNTFWLGQDGSNLTRFNPAPVATETRSIPLLASVPKGEKPELGWPVVIYQHGITRRRSDVAVVADVLAQAGFAVVAIDLPLHGITGNETDGSAAFFAGDAERTFNLDLVDNATGSPGPDGITDESGTHFINLRSLLTSRDNVRQGVSDVLTLSYALSALDYDGGGPDFNIHAIRFLGHSLGGIVGQIALALEPEIGAGALVFTGGGIPKLLDGSAAFGAQIAAGLASAGVLKGTADYESFMGAAQTVLDAGDPVNYPTAASSRGLLLQEIVGGNSSPPDQVIPNNVTTLAPPGTVPAPLSGTDPLIPVLGLTLVDQSVGGADIDGDLDVAVRFNAGHHGSLLTPNDAQGQPDPLSAQVTAELQSQIAGFLATNGVILNIQNGDVIQPVSQP